jgi:glycosyltransferase involved in cell wall biosynthesis
MVDAIQMVWTSEELQAEMRKAGLEQAAKFSWDQTAEETREVYQRLLV